MMRAMQTVGVAVLAAGVLFACANDGPRNGNDVEAARQPIVNGTATNDAKYDAVGSLILKAARYGYEDVKCSGTLIAPQVFLTAKHCVKHAALGAFPDTNSFVGFGPNAWRPAQKVQIKSFLSAPPSPTHSGLLTNGGRDIAVLYLDRAPDGITPAKIGAFDASMLGTAFDIAGFGWTETFNVGLKYAGPATARALSGDWYPLLFNGDWARFDEWYWTDASLAMWDPAEEELWWTPGVYELEPGYELLAGGLPNEAVGCFGDSGGPLLRGSSAEDMTVYGVSFAAEGSMAAVCGLGGGYLVLNDEMRGWVQQAIALAPTMLGR